MQFRLRSLLIILALGPPLIAGWVAMDRDPFQIFLAVGFIAYALVCILVGTALGRMFHALTKLL